MLRFIFSLKLFSYNMYFIMFFLSPPPPRSSSTPYLPNFVHSHALPFSLSLSKKKEKKKIIINKKGKKKAYSKQTKNEAIFFIGQLLLGMGSVTDLWSTGHAQCGVGKEKLCFIFLWSGLKGVWSQCLARQGGKWYLPFNMMR